MTKNEINYISGILYENFLDIVKLVNLLIEKGASQKEIERALRYNFQTILNWSEGGFQHD